MNTLGQPPFRKRFLAVRISPETAIELKVRAATRALDWAVLTTFVVILSLGGVAITIYSFAQRELYLSDIPSGALMLGVTGVAIAFARDAWQTFGLLNDGMAKRR